MATTNIDMRQINITAGTFDGDKGITLVIESVDEEYRAPLTESNARWLSEALKRAVKLSEMRCN